MAGVARRAAGTLLCGAHPHHGRSRLMPQGTAQRRDAWRQDRERGPVLMRDPGRASEPHLPSLKWVLGYLLVGGGEVSEPLPAPSAFQGSPHPSPGLGTPCLPHPLHLSLNTVPAACPMSPLVLSDRGGGIGSQWVGLGLPSEEAAWLGGHHRPQGLGVGRPHQSGHVPCGLDAHPGPLTGDAPSKGSHTKVQGGWG